MKVRATELILDEGRICAQPGEVGEVLDAVTEPDGVRALLVMFPAAPIATLALLPCLRTCPAWRWRGACGAAPPREGGRSGRLAARTVPERPPRAHRPGRVLPRLRQAAVRRWV